MGVNRPIRHQQGFSLFELLLVLLMISLLSGMVMLNLNSGGGSEQRAAARSLAAGLRMAREQAQSTQRDVVLLIDVAKRSFQFDQRTIALSSQVPVHLFTAKAEQRSRDIGGIRFFPDGSSTGGHVEIGNAFRVNVDWLTGRVQVLEIEAKP